MESSILQLFIITSIGTILGGVLSAAIIVTSVLRHARLTQQRLFAESEMASSGDTKETQTTAVVSGEAISSKQKTDNLKDRNTKPLAPSNLVTQQNHHHSEVRYAS